MIAKTIEIRDRATLVPVLAVRLEPTNDADTWLLARAGMGEHPAQQAAQVMVWPMEGGADVACVDPFDHGHGRTRRLAHEYIRRHFDELASGDVVDVEFISGESSTPKVSERLEAA